jgi:hypothetical protein
MKRTVWTAVLVTAALMAAASMLGNPSSWRLPHVPPGLAGAGAWSAFWLAAHPWRMPEVPLAGVAWVSFTLGAAAFALGITLVIPRRAGRPRILRLARDGWSSARIARRTGLAQDAVRSLLQPGIERRGGTPGARQHLPSGRSLRSREHRPAMGTNAVNALR